MWLNDDFDDLRRWSPVYNLNTNVKNSLLLIQLYVFTNPTAWVGCNTKSILMWSLTGLNSEFSFILSGCLTKAKGLSLPYYLPIAGGRIIGFIAFPKGISAVWKMQSALSRIWTHVAVSISYDDNHYTTDTSKKLSIIHVYGLYFSWFAFSNVKLWIGIS